ncbi:Carbonic anhydrase 2 [Tepidimonas thermarum]|uniref:Carbonic anhydrase n=1 Tax=Tepidimonas thermarum TaxID=335431 RepID=A0A554X4I7_9BURK|nr:carbonate dehydratase [Tepidimonas thermarum]TSE30760.1 Carbonic anhydrase 2 [Tepidimonas thermarum]
MPLRHLLAHNREWAARMEAERPGFFSALARQQSPRYMWIGCSDSRVPANQITGLEPGEVFVHRNVANVVVPTDLNCLSTLQYAVDMLHVEHVMVVGHYGCGGVQAALDGLRVGLADNWLRHVRDVADRYARLLQALPAPARLDVLCELNVIEQVRHVAQSTVLQDAWARGQAVTVHGWVYGLRDGLLQDLQTSVRGVHEVESVYHAAREALLRRCGLDLS